jgi:Ca2+-binding EF-hand superfamily protein
MDKDIIETFELLDGNKDGIVTIDELGNTIKLLNPKVKDIDVKEVINEFTPEMDLGLYEALWKAKLKEGKVENEYATLFEFFDKDRNGLIDASDLIEGLTAIGATISPEEADEMILEADLDGDRLLDVEEFQRIVNSII